MSEDLKFYTIAKKVPCPYTECPIGLFMLGDALYLKTSPTTRVGIPANGERPSAPCSPETLVIPIELRLSSFMDLYAKVAGEVEPRFEQVMDSVLRGVETTMTHATNIVERIAKAMEEPEPVLYEVWTDQWIYANGAKTLTKTEFVTKLGEAKAKSFELACYEVCRGYDPMSFHCPQGKPMLGQNFLYPTEAMAKAGRSRY